MWKPDVETHLKIAILISKACYIPEPIYFIMQKKHENQITSYWVLFNPYILALQNMHWPADTQLVSNVALQA